MNIAIQGWMTPPELEWLEKAASMMASVAEVGCWRGRSTHSFLEHCKGPVYAVDHWRGSRDELSGPHLEAVTGDIHAEFLGNVGHFPNLKIRKGSSTEVAPTLPMVDMAFIDAGHAYDEVVADLEAWAPKCLRLIAGHDYDYPEVGKAVKERFGDRVKRGPGSIWFVEHPNPPRIMVGTPAYALGVTSPCARSIMRLMSEPNPYGIKVRASDWSSPADSLIGRSRIRVFSHFLASDCTHLMFIDGDIEFDHRDVFHLLRWGKDVVGGVYPCKSLTPTWPCNFITGEDKIAIVCPETGCLLARDLPTGFMLISRNCADKMAVHYGDRHCRIEPGEDRRVNDHAYNLFDQPIDLDRMLLSEDFAFCRHWQNIGGEVWIDPQIHLKHWGMHCYDHGTIADSVLKAVEPEAVAVA